MILIFHLPSIASSLEHICLSTVQNNLFEFVEFDFYSFQSEVQQIDTISYHVKTLSTLLDELIEERATDNPTRYRQRLDALHLRYKKLLVAIDETSQHCSIIIPSKIIHENSQDLNESLTNISNAPVDFRDLSDVRTVVQGQTRVCNILESFSQQIIELVTRGNELLKQPMVPKYVQQDTHHIQKLYNDKVQSAKDFLERHQVIQ